MVMNILCQAKKAPPWCILSTIRKCTSPRASYRLGLMVCKKGFKYSQRKQNNKVYIGSTFGVLIQIPNKLHCNEPSFFITNGFIHVFPCFLVVNYAENFPENRSHVAFDLKGTEKNISFYHIFVRG